MVIPVLYWVSRPLASPQRTWAVTNLLRKLDRIVVYPLGSFPKETSGRKPVLYEVVLYSWYLVLRDSQRTSGHGSISQRKGDQERRGCLFMNMNSDGLTCFRSKSVAFRYFVDFPLTLFWS